MSTADGGDTLAPGGPRFRRRRDWTLARRLSVAMTNGIIAVALGAILAVPGGLVSQEAQTPVFRSGVDIVQIYATVRDASGQPVSGLHAKDFSVFDNNRRVPLEVVTEVATPAFEGPEWARQHSTGVSSNEPLAEKRLVVIILDDARMSLFGRDRDRLRELGREVVKNLSPDDLACVVFTATNSGAQDFTSDRGLLLGAMESLAGGFGSTNYPPIMAAYSVDVVRRVAAMLAQTPARRRMIVFLGTGQAIHILPPNTSKPTTNPPIGSRMTFDTFSVAGRVDALLKAAQSSGTAVYVIDPRAQVREQRSPMTQFVKDLAKHTGAIAVVGEPDPAEAARRVMRDASHYYLLGFRADESLRPGTYRRLRVEVSKAGLDVRSQTGYYPPRTAVGDEPLPELEGAPTTAPLSGILPTGPLPLRMSLAAFAGARAGGLRGRVAVNIESGTLGSAAARPTGPVRMELRVFDGEGRKEIAALADRRSISSAGRLTPSPVIQVPPGRYSVRVAIQHGDGLLTGSVYGTVTVPDFAGNQLTTSSVFVHVPGVVPDAWRSGVSSVRRTFARAESVSLVMGLYGAGRTMVVVVDLAIVDASDNVVHREARSLQVSPAESSPETEVRFELPLVALAPGQYLAQLSIRAEKVALHREVVFAVR